MKTAASVRLPIDVAQLVEIAQRTGITFLVLFGSFARNQSRADSDIDLAVRFGRPVTLFDLAGAQLEFQQVLNRAVDLIPLDSAYPFVRQEIEREGILLYQADTEQRQSTDANA